MHTRMELLFYYPISSNSSPAITLVSNAAHPLILFLSEGSHSNEKRVILLLLKIAIFARVKIHFYDCFDIWKKCGFPFNISTSLKSFWSTLMGYINLSREKAVLRISYRSTAFYSFKGVFK